MTEARILGGRYELIRLLGRGGMADVYLGSDVRLGRTVAIKLLRADLAKDPQFQARFRREAQAVAGLNHPAIVGVYDTGDVVIQEPDQKSLSLPYIVMEYVQGRTLQDLLRTEELSIDQSIEYTLGVLSALEYSHRAGIVHRDIKPANVMVTQSGAVKVMDFGIARAIADSSGAIPQTQAVAGTAQYLSPEQARGESVDTRSDLYSASCLLYELLTGRPPFTGDSPVNVAYQHVQENPDPPSTYNPEVTPALDSVVLRGLEKDPEQRFQDAASFRRSLRAAQVGVELENLPEEEEDESAHMMAPVPLASDLEGGENTDTGMFDPIYDDDDDDDYEDEEDDYEDYDEDEDEEDEDEEDEDEDEAKKKRRKRAWIIAGLVALALLLGGGAWALNNKNNEKPSEPTLVYVPETNGKTESEAIRSLLDAGLQKSRTEETFDDNTPSGKVIGTEPKVGTKVRPESTVMIKLSKGPSSVEIPASLANTTESSARDALRSIGLKPGSTEIVDDPKIATGLIVDTNPGLGQKVESGSIVNLKVSSGKVIMPALYGKTQDAATKELQAVTPSLKTNFVEEENTQVQPGKVVRQSVREGDKVDQSATVTITIAKAPPTQSPPASNSPSPNAPAPTAPPNR